MAGIDGRTSSVSNVHTFSVPESDGTGAMQGIRSEVTAVANRAKEVADTGATPEQQAVEAELSMAGLTPDVVDHIVDTHTNRYVNCETGPLEIYGERPARGDGTRIQPDKLVETWVATAPPSLQEAGVVGIIYHIEVINDDAVKVAAYAVDAAEIERGSDCIRHPYVYSEDRPILGFQAAIGIGSDLTAAQYKVYSIAGDQTMFSQIYADESSVGDQSTVEFYPLSSQGVASFMTPLEADFLNEATRELGLHGWLVAEQ